MVSTMAMAAVSLFGCSTWCSSSSCRKLVYRARLPTQKPSCWALSATSSSCLRAVMEERVMALVANGGVAAKAASAVVATNSTARGVAATLAGDGVAATAVTSSNYLRKIYLLVVYTNDSVVENSINRLEQLLAEDDKYKVVGFNIEYTSGRAGHDQMVSVTELCVRHYVLVYHYFLDTRPREHLTRFLNNPGYMFATVDTINDVKVLKTLGMSCQNLVNIQS
ncbi:hypothetical protein D1007_04989 [Hordeum vulgare]|nr:hypothetical protein D1007_04989 [Hordeum vulgare]